MAARCVRRVAVLSRGCVRAPCSQQPSVYYCSSIVSGRMEVNGVNIHYQQTGNGDHVVLLLPGALGCSKTDFGPQLTSLNKNVFTIIAWDPRGYGCSIPPNRDYPPDFFERDAKDAIDLMQALNFKRFSLLGWSDGGITALIAAARYPSLIHKLVVWGANAYVTEEDLKLYNAVKDVSKWSEKMRKPMEALYGKEYFTKTFEAWVEAMNTFTSRPDGKVGVLESLQELFRILDCGGWFKCHRWGKLQTQGLGAAFKILFSDTQNADIPEQGPWRTFYLKCQHSVALFNAFKRLPLLLAARGGEWSSRSFCGMRGNICQHLLPFIECPALIIHGEKDVMVPPFHPRFIHQQIKDSRLHLMPDGKHNLHLRYAEEFNRLVEEFLC